MLVVLVGKRRASRIIPSGRDASLSAYLLLRRPRIPMRLPGSTPFGCHRGSYISPPHKIQRYLLYSSSASDKQPTSCNYVQVTEI